MVIEIIQDKIDKKREKELSMMNNFNRIARRLRSRYYIIDDCLYLMKKRSFLDFLNEQPVDLKIYYNESGDCFHFGGIRIYSWVFDEIENILDKMEEKFEVKIA